MAPSWLDAFAAVWIPLSVLAAVGVLVDAWPPPEDGDHGRRLAPNAALLGTARPSLLPLVRPRPGARRTPPMAPDLKDGERRPICSRSLSARRTAARAARSAIGSPSHSPWSACSPSWWRSISISGRADRPVLLGRDAGGDAIGLCHDLPGQLGADPRRRQRGDVRSGSSGLKLGENGTIRAIVAVT